MRTVEDIARVCHEANRAYCITIGDNTQVDWDSAPDWQRHSAMEGVRFHLHHADAGPKGSHESWLALKVAEGWKYGPKKDPERKLHPCVVPYQELPPEQQMKDALFVSIVLALKSGGVCE